MTKLSRAARVILVGAPGVGKGTQTERLIKQFPQLSAISSGDLLRYNVRNRTALGLQAEAKMKTGDLVPDSMILRLILNELKTRGWLKTESVLPYQVNYSSLGISTNFEEPPEDDPYVTGPMPPHKYNYSNSPYASFVLDGFPRTASQAESIDDLIPINLVVHLDTPSEVILDRIRDRVVHAPSGRVYNLTFNPPKVEGKDDITGEPLTRRDDDDPEVWKTRLANHEKTSMPLLEHYDKMGVLWCVKGNSSDDISPQLFKEFARRFGK